MSLRLRLVAASALVIPLAAPVSNKVRLMAQTAVAPQGTWRFVVSGDSRNCGDVVMPAIAAHSSRFSPSFYWHLGDLRAVYKIDEDMEAASLHRQQTLTCEAYYRRAWTDFVESQIAPFGDTPFFIGIGNHEVIPPKSEDLFTAQFRDWLLLAPLNAQRLQDGEKPPLLPRPFYHWSQNGVDFIYLDNASGSFSPGQLDWFDRVLAADKANNAVLGVVVGMHEALPDSIASKHAMCDDPGKPEGCTSGRHVYEALLKLQKDKPVYVLASHSHFYMQGIFDNLPPERRLPGWIVGTAGAVRYALPPKAPPSARTDVYGYLLATAHNGTIDFQFEQLGTSDVPEYVWERYAPSLVHWCFAHNSQNIDPNAEETTHRCPAPPGSR